MIIDIIGWLGVLILNIAYIGLTIEKFRSIDILYQIMNLLGAFFILINSYYYKAYPSVVANLLWMVIAMYGLKPKSWLLNIKA